VTEHVRVCRECGEEYRAGVAVCADCGGELEDRLLGDDGEAVPPAGAPAAPPVEGPAHRVVFVTPRATELVPLAEALREAEIAYRLAEQPPAADGAPVRYALLVEEKDAKGALRALGPVLVPEEHEAAAETIETRFAEGRGYVACPACGAHQPESATECPECGLDLGGQAASCPRCGEAVADPDAACPSCGAPPAR
jgi:hypothetical protein